MSEDDPIPARELPTGWHVLACNHGDLGTQSSCRGKVRRLFVPVQALADGGAGFCARQNDCLELHSKCGTPARLGQEGGRAIVGVIDFGEIRNFGN